MNTGSTVKKILSKLDRYSPHPVFYRFIISKDEKSIFDNAIKKSRCYLEYGMGGSTLRALTKSDAVIYTVESDSAWIEHMRKYIKVRRAENDRMHIISIYIGPTRKWGYPDSDKFIDTFEAYSSEVFRYVDGKQIDLAFIDGRFRVACALKVIMECYRNSNTQIMIHDFWNRPQYHVLLHYLDVIERADTLGLFSIKNNVDLNSVADDYAHYKVIAE